jgi:hypothetical protein
MTFTMVRDLIKIDSDVFGPGRTVAQDLKSVPMTHFRGRRAPDSESNVELLSAGVT